MDHDNIDSRLLIPEDEDLDGGFRPEHGGADAMLLLFRQAQASEAYSPQAVRVTASPPETPTIPPPTPALVPADPSFGSQWHLLNTGQFGGTPGIDINVTKVWEDYSGQGVVVGVVDDGVEFTHQDLSANYDINIDYDYGGNDSNAFPSGSAAHGTAVAGLIAADNNSVGGVGVAYDATVTGYKIFGGSVTFGEFQDLFNRHVNSGVDISSNSWTFVGEFADNFQQGGWSLIDAGINNAVTNGRGGLGTVILFAAGNGRTDGESSDYHNMQNARETISVAAIDNRGNVSWYSNPGASLLVATPSNGGSAGIFTTDRSGSTGYSSGDYTSGFGGTSAATPITSGVVALMLEANPNLGYRDVQEILAYSARLVDAGDPGWAWNGADNWNGGGLHTNHDYGFGLTDAFGAVRLAETWTQQSVRANELVVSGSSSPGQAIPDGGSISDTITLSSGLKIDHVEVTLNIAHSHVGDLIVRLISPDGTESLIVNRADLDPGSSTSDGSNLTSINFTIGSTNHWGESGAGTWTLVVEDPGSYGTGTLNSWTLRIYGDADNGDDLYVYNDEYGSFTGAGDAGRRTLEDDDGGNDTLNAASVTSDITLDLAPGGGGTLAGNSFAIAPGTLIENATLGDGNDRVVGNDADNILLGARGDDDLQGGGGNDSLGGGRGDDRLDGGADFDLALFAYGIENYAFSFLDAVSVTIDYIGGGAVDEGFDTVTNVEQFSFAEVLYAFADLPGGSPPAVDSFFAIAPSDAVKAEGDNGTTAFSFTVTRSGDLSGAAQVDYAIAGAGADAANAADFGGSLPSGTLFFAAGETSKQIAVDVTGDTTFEADEGFTVTLSGASAGNQITTASADGTIQNDDAAPPATFFAIAATDASKAEGDGGTTPFTFTVTRSGDLSGSQQVSYALTNEDTDAADFGGRLPSGVLVFAAGESSKQVTIDVSGDTVVEDDEDFTVTLSNASAGATITTASAGGTIRNDDDPPAGASVTLLEADFDAPGDFGGFTYADGVFGGPSNQPYSSGQWDAGRLAVDMGGIDTADILDMSGAWQIDFTLATAMVVEVSFLYEMVQSQYYESDEYGRVYYSLSGSAPVLLDQLTGDGNGGSTQTTGVRSYSGDLGLLAAGSYTLSIGGYSNKKTYINELTEVFIDDVLVTGASTEPPPDPETFFSIAATDAVKAEGDAGTTSYSFTVTRSGLLSGADTVDFAVTGGTADAADFGGSLPSGTVSFAAGETSKLVTIAVTGDTAFEADEGFTVSLSNPSTGVIVSGADAGGTILNDDPWATFAIAPSDAVKAEGDAGTTPFSFTVTRSGDLSHADQVNYAVTGASAADFGGSLPSGTLAFSAGEASKVITVQVTGDTAFEADEGFTVTLSNASENTEITTAAADGTILNDDPWATFAIEATDAVKAEGDSGTTPFTFTVTRSGDLSHTDSVELTVTGGDVDAADFLGGLPAGIVTFDPGESSHVVTLDVLGDEDYEADEDFTVSLSNASEGTEVITAAADGTILNDDPRASFAIAPTDAVKAEGDAGTTPFSFTVTRSGELGNADQVSYAVTGADAADFGGSLPSGTVAFAAGESSKLVTIDVVGDTLFEPDEGFTVTLSGNPLDTEIIAAAANGTILNDDPWATFAIAPSDAVKDEGNAGTTPFGFTVTRSGDLSHADQVDYAVTGASAADFGGSLPSGTLAFAAGEASKVVTVDVTGDTAFEADEGFTVTLSNASENTEITTAAANGTILNDDPHASFAIAPTDAVKDEGDSGTTAFTFTVTRSGDLSQADQVDYAVTGADASDFGGTLPSGTLAFAVGEASKLVTVEVSGDTAFEADEGFTVTLSNASENTEITTAAANGTILNDDPHASFAIGPTDAVKDEGDSGTTAFTFTVTRSGDLSQADQVDFAVTGADASDFGGSLPSGTLAFAVGEASKLVTVEVSGDTAFEADEGFTVTLSNPSAGTEIGTASAAGTILNDDPAPPETFFAIAATDAVKTEGDGGTTLFSFTVTRSGDLSGADQVGYVVNDGGAATASDFAGAALPGGSLGFAAGETSKVVEIAVAGDTDLEIDEGFTVSLTLPSPGTEIITPTAAGTILNDDVAPPTVFFSIELVAGDTPEGDAGFRPFNYLVTRSGDLSGSQQLDFEVEAVGGVTAEDFVGGLLPSGTVAFAPGETTQVISLEVAGDRDYEADEEITVTLSNAPPGTEITTASASGTVFNDDPRATFGITPVVFGLDEGDTGTARFIYDVTRSGDLSQTDQIDYVVFGYGFDPASASDFVGDVFPSGTLVFAPGESSKTVFIDASGDTELEASESFRFELANAPADTAITALGALGTILNDDPDNFFAVEATDAVKAEGDSGTTDFTFTVTRSGKLSLPTSVQYSVSGSGDNPASAEDFLASTLPGGILLFEAGESSKTVTVRIAGDAALEADEGFTVTLSNPSGLGAITTATADGTIQNDDPHALFSIAPALSLVDEGDSGTTDYTFTVTRSGDLSGADQVDFEVTGVAADALDFGGSFPSGTVLFAAGEASKTLAIGVSGDTDFEDNELFKVSLSNASAGTEIASADAFGTILNDDPAPPETFFAIAADDAVKSEGDDGSTSFTFTVTRSGVVFGSDQVGFTVTAAGADAADFGGSFPSGTLVFGPDETSRTVTVAVSGDRDFEADEGFTVTLSDPSPGSAVTTASANGTILNDDPHASFAIAPTDAVKAEGDSGTMPFTFTVTRSGDLSGLDQVDYAVTGADASDFGGSLPSGTLAFAAGESSKLVTVAVSGDTSFETDEGFTVTLSDPSPGSAITTASANGTILNDDPHASFAIAPTDAVKAEGDSGTTPFIFTVTRSGDLSGLDQVDYAVTGADASDFGGSLPSGTLTFAVGESSKLVTVAVSGDTFFESDEDFTVALSSASAGTVIDTGSAEGTIQNDDAAPPPSAPVTLVDEDFDGPGDTGGFSYLDSAFGGPVSQPYASGQWANGALAVTLGGIDTADILDMSGAWQVSFTLDSEMTVSLSFLYELTQAGTYEPDEYNQVIYSLSGSTPVLLQQLNGGSLSTGQRSYDGDLGLLAAGDYTLAIGSYNNKKTYINESSILTIDDVVIVGTPSGPPPPVTTFFEIAATDAVKDEGDGGTTSYGFTVTRSGDLSGSDAVSFEVSGSGADPADAADFPGGLLPDGTLSFAPGETSKDIVVEVAGDNFLEPDEGFTVTLGDPSPGSEITTATAEGRIVNDDDSGGTLILVSADFNGLNDTEGFAYADGVFGGAAPQTYADGDWTNGALEVGLGGLDTADITDMSGAWTIDFTLDSDMAVSIAFDYQLTLEAYYESNEFSQVLFALSGQSPVVVDQIVGDGNGGTTDSTGLQSFAADLGVLTAGDYSLSIGAYNNLKTYINESTQLLIDDVLITGTIAGPAGAAAEALQLDDILSAGSGDLPAVDEPASSDSGLIMQMSLQNDLVDLAEINIVA